MSEYQLVYTFSLRYKENGAAKVLTKHIVANNFLQASTKWCHLASVQEISNEQIDEIVVTQKEC